MELGEKMVQAATEKRPFSFLREERAFAGIMNHCARHLFSMGISLPREHLTIVDVGAGRMPYGLALEAWAYQQAKNARIIAVDTAYVPEYAQFLPPGFKFYPETTTHWQQTVIEKVGCSIEEALPKLRQLGVSRIDVVTMFNPGMAGFPKVKSLEELCHNIPVVGAMISPSKFHDGLLHEEFAKQGYAVCTFPNPIPAEILKVFSHYSPDGYVYDYNPLFVALRNA